MVRRSARTAAKAKSGKEEKTELVSLEDTPTKPRKRKAPAEGREDFSWIDPEYVPPKKTTMSSKEALAERKREDAKAAEEKKKAGEEKEAEELEEAKEGEDADEPEAAAPATDEPEAAAPATDEPPPANEPEADAGLYSLSARPKRGRVEWPVNADPNGDGRRRAYHWVSVNGTPHMKALGKYDLKYTHEEGPIVEYQQGAKRGTLRFCGEKVRRMNPGDGIYLYTTRKTKGDVSVPFTDRMALRRIASITWYPGFEEAIEHQSVQKVSPGFKPATTNAVKELAKIYASEYAGGKVEKDIEECGVAYIEVIPIPTIFCQVSREVTFRDYKAARAYDLMEEAIPDWAAAECGQILTNTLDGDIEDAVDTMGGDPKTAKKDSEAVKALRVALKNAAVEWPVLFPLFHLPPVMLPTVKVVQYIVDVVWFKWEKVVRPLDRIEPPYGWAHRNASNYLDFGKEGCGADAIMLMIGYARAEAIIKDMLTALSPFSYWESRIEAQRPLMDMNGPQPFLTLPALEGTPVPHENLGRLRTTVTLADTHSHLAIGTLITQSTDYWGRPAAEEANQVVSELQRKFKAAMEDLETRCMKAIENQLKGDIRGSLGSLPRVVAPIEEPDGEDSEATEPDPMRPPSSADEDYEDEKSEGESAQEEEKPSKAPAKKKGKAAKLAKMKRGDYPPAKGRWKTQREAMRNPTTCEFAGSEKDWVLTKDGKLPTNDELDALLKQLDPPLERNANDPKNRVIVVWHTVLWLAHKGHLPSKATGIHHPTCSKMLESSAKADKVEGAQEDAVDFIVELSAANAAQMGLDFSGGCTHCRGDLRKWAEDLGDEKLLKQGVLQADLDALRATASKQKKPEKKGAKGQEKKGPKKGGK